MMPQRGSSAPLDSGNNLKQLGIAVMHYDGSPSPVESDYSGAHALDAGECSVDFCAKNSPPASPASVDSRGYAGATSSWY
jgi:hypothetical protein